jgi:hypothetical protein
MLRSLSKGHRRHARASVSVYANKVMGDTPHLVLLSDISLGGAYLQRLLEPEAAPVEVLLELRLTGGDETLWLLAAVVRTDRRGTAVRFLDLSAADRRSIAAHVQAVQERAA